MIHHPVELLQGVREALEKLQPHYRLIVLTKGDLLDQERKLEKSGLSEYFHHVEVLNDKTEAHYQRLLDHLEVDVSEFLMVGNSLKSDILPIVNLGARAVHIPFYITWQHERVEETEERKESYRTLSSITELPDHLLLT